MICIDDEYEIKGTYDTLNSINLVVVFELCDREKRSTCKSDEEIKKKLEGSYIIILENKQTYQPNEFPGSPEQIKNFSKFYWYPMSVEIALDYPREA